MKARIPLLTVLLLSASVASAAVYKWVDEQGNVHYGDLPPGGESAEPVKLPGLSTVQTRRPSTGEQGDAGSDQAPFTGYRRVAIAQPESSGTVRNNQQRVPVRVELEPALQPGHALVIYLDNEKVGEPMTTPSFQLEGVARGGHSLKAEVVDAAGQVLAVSSNVYFTMRQAAVEPEPVEPPSGDDPFPPQYKPSADQGKDYTPPDGAAPYPPPADQPGDYQPANGASPHKPGATAPGYAPAYTP